MNVFIVSRDFGDGFGSPMAVFSTREAARVYIDKTSTDKRFDHMVIHEKQVDEHK